MRIWISLFSPAIVLFVWAGVSAVSSTTGNTIGRIALGITLIAHACAEWKIHKQWRQHRNART